VVVLQGRGVSLGREPGSALRVVLVCLALFESNASGQRRRRALGWLSKTARHGSSRNYVIEVVVFGSPMVWLALG
jgi:hypothetical protein